MQLQLELVENEQCVSEAECTPGLSSICGIAVTLITATGRPRFKYPEHVYVVASVIIIGFIVDNCFLTTVKENYVIIDCIISKNNYLFIV